MSCFKTLYSAINKLLMFFFFFNVILFFLFFFFFQAEDGIRDKLVTGVQTCALPIFFTGIRKPETRTNTILTTIMLVGFTGLLFTALNLRPAPHQYENQVNSYLQNRSEEHTSELQSLAYLVCRLLLEKKKHM